MWWCISGSAYKKYFLIPLQIFYLVVIWYCIVERMDLNLSTYIWTSKTLHHLEISDIQWLVLLAQTSDSSWVIRDNCRQYVPMFPRAFLKDFNEPKYHIYKIYITAYQKEAYKIASFTTISSFNGYLRLLWLHATFTTSTFRSKMLR